MNPMDCISKLCTIDDRNLFGTNQLQPEEIDQLARYDPFLPRFYQEANPLDVEVFTKKWGSIGFIPYEELAETQKHYGIQNYLVIASINGDPVAVNKIGVYLGVHGSDSFSFIQIAPDFLGFLQAISTGGVSPPGDN